jgi:hypothetical protein
MGPLPARWLNQPNTIIYHPSKHTHTPTPPSLQNTVPSRTVPTHSLEQYKWKAVVTEIARIHKEGRPILVGTTSVEKSELLSGLLDEQGIKHQVRGEGGGWRLAAVDGRWRGRWQVALPLLFSLLDVHPRNPTPPPNKSSNSNHQPLQTKP